MIDQSLRILQVSPKDRGGGAEGSAWTLFSQYRDRGYTSWLAVGRRWSSDPDVYVVDNGLWSRLWRPKAPAFDVRAITSRVASKIAYYAAPTHLASQVSGLEDLHFPGAHRVLDLPPVRPTVLHCHNLHGGYFDLRAISTLGRALPVVLNLRDAWLLTGHCAIPIGCERWRIGCGACPDLTIYPPISRDATAKNRQRKRKILDESLYYLATPSRWMMNMALEAGCKPAAKVVIPNGVDTTVFHPGDRAHARDFLGIPQDATVLLFIAHSEFRDIATTKAALARLDWPTSRPLIALCVGRSGVDERIGSIEIRHTPFITAPKSLATYYQAADVYLHAALGESFGKTVIEAMACGLPVVATATGGIPEVVSHGVTGELTPERDPERLADATQSLLDNPQLRQEFGANGLRRILAHFTIGDQVSAFLAWYQEILTDWTERNRHGDVRPRI